MAFNIFFLLYFGLRFIAANDKEQRVWTVKQKATAYNSVILVFFYFSVSLRLLSGYIISPYCARQLQAHINRFINTRMNRSPRHTRELSELQIMFTRCHSYGFGLKWTQLLTFSPCLQERGSLLSESGNGKNFLINERVQCSISKLGEKNRFFKVSSKIEETLKYWWNLDGLVHVPISTLNGSFPPFSSVCLSLSESYVAWFTFSPRSPSFTVLWNFAVRQHPENIKLYQTCKSTLNFPVYLAHRRRLYSSGREYGWSMGGFYQFSIGKLDFILF